MYTGDEVYTGGGDHSLRLYIDYIYIYYSLCTRREETVVFLSVTATVGYGRSVLQFLYFSSILFLQKFMALD